MPVIAGGKSWVPKHKKPTATEIIMTGCENIRIFKGPKPVKTGETPLRIPPRSSKAECQKTDYVLKFT